MGKTRIDWCDWTWNPVWGCLRNCPYCYARRIAKRFGIKLYDKNIQYITGKNDGEISVKKYELLESLHDFKPVWLESNFQKKFLRKFSRIFVDSMSDISYWKHSWICKILAKIKKYPQHTFIFLTKNFDIYADYEFSQNCWLGYTIINQKQMDELAYDDAFYPPEKKYKFFISMEPIQEKIKLIVKPDWLIVGAETGNRKNKIIPEKSWIANLLLEADKYKIPFFMKDNLKNIWGESLIQEFPE